MKSIIEILEETKNEMCMNYCKYADECMEELDKQNTSKRCDECPLNKL